MFDNRVLQFFATLNDAKIVSKNQVMRIVELYAVMMLIIIISWIIYSIFKVKEPAQSDPYDEEEQEHLQANRRGATTNNQQHMQLEMPRTGN